MRSAILDLTTIRERLAELGTLAGLRSYAYPPDQPAVGQAGALIVDEADDTEAVTYHEDSDGLITVRLVLLVLVSATSKREAIEAIDRLRGRGTPGSLLDAINGDPSLGERCDFVRLLTAGPAHLSNYGEDVNYWSAEWSVEVRG